MSAYLNQPLAPLSLSNSLCYGRSESRIGYGKGYGKSGSFANKLDLYYAKQGYAQGFIVPKALAIDIRMTKVQLEGLEHLCRAWLDEFLSKVEEVQ